MSAITVGYWSIRGLGAPLRMMVMFAGVPLQAECYDVAYNAAGEPADRSHWTGVKPALKERNALMNLPYVIDGDFVVTQSNACATYLGRKLGMMGDSPQETSQIEQLLCEAYDIRNGVVGFAYGRDTTPFSKYIANATVAGGSIDKLNLWMSRKVESVGSPEFFVGKKASAADFFLCEILDQIKTMAVFFKEEDPFKNFSFVADFLVKFKALPQNARYFESRLANFPCNNLSAINFGATPTGEPSTPSTPRPWQGSSGLY